MDGVSRPGRPAGRGARPAGYSPPGRVATPLLQLLLSQLKPGERDAHQQTALDNQPVDRWRLKDPPALAGYSGCQPGWSKLAP